jgi:hypothetical protein
MSVALPIHLKAMYRVMKYCISTPNRGKVFAPKRRYSGNDFEFEIVGRSDSDYAKDPEKRRSVSGFSTFLEGAPMSTKSRMQQCVTLSVTEAEYGAATECVQDMLFGMRIIESIGLKVKKPMTLDIDNKGAVDLANNWSAGGRTRHVDVRHFFLRELKEDEIIQIRWIPTEVNSSDLFTKNLDGTMFGLHTEVYCGIDEYGNGLN